MLDLCFLQVGEKMIDRMKLLGDAWDSSRFDNDSQYRLDYILLITMLDIRDMLHKQEKTKLKRLIDRWFT